MYCFAEFDVVAVVRVWSCLIVRGLSFCWTSWVFFWCGFLVSFFVLGGGAVCIDVAWMAGRWDDGVGVWCCGS